MAKKLQLWQMDLKPTHIKSIRSICRHLNAVESLYLFGSRAQDKASSRSDYDFAVLFTREASSARKRTKINYAKLQLDLLGKLISVVRSDYVDLVVLNTCINSILKFNVVQQGILLFERSVISLDYEIATKHEFYDFTLMEKQYL